MGCIGYLVHVVFGVMLVSGEEKQTQGLMYPRESETREVRSLDGLWKFARSNPFQPSEGLTKKWYSKDLSDFTEVINMPVPSSYNDIGEDAELRDHVGTVWYERKFFVPKSWQSQRVWVRFGSVHYESYVWINGENVARHAFGHLPFEAEITNQLKFGQENRITVLCDNVLLQTTIPQGKIIEQDSDNDKTIVQTYTFDFFNYAGIHRSVHLYTTPATFIKEIVLDSSVDEEGHGHVRFNIIQSDNSTSNYAKVAIYDKEENLVDTQSVDASLSGEAIIKDVKRWWPYLMHPEPAYLYTIEVKLSTPTEENVDIYRMKFGVRTLKWDNTTFTINDKPIYFRGFGRHEDSDVSACRG
jgi:beta-glucuronidase